jgi:hypothetical protein
MLLAHSSTLDDAVERIQDDYCKLHIAGLFAIFAMVAMIAVVAMVQMIEMI